MKKTLILSLLLLTVAGATGEAQETYFGKNKVRYKDFEWSFIQTRHFDIYFYEEAYASAKFAATVLESAYVEISRELSYMIRRRVPVFVPYIEFYGYASLFLRAGGRQCDLGKLDAAGIRTFGIAVAIGGVTYFQIGPQEYEVAGPPEWALERLRSDFDGAMREVQACRRVRVIRAARDLPPDPLGGRIGVIPLVTCHSYMTEVGIIDEEIELFP